MLRNFGLFNESSDADDAQKQEKKQNLRQTIVGVAAWFVLSSVCVVLYALYAASQGPEARGAKFLGVLSSSTLVGAAFISIGALLGFLFGIPRTPKDAAQTAPQAPAPSTASSASAASPRPDGLRPNTNLEEISDWLTKILVGAGLAQLAVLPSQLKKLAEFFQTSMPLSTQAALMILLNFFVLGFMGSYLLTRLFLTEAFRTAEEPAAGLRAVSRVAQDLLPEIAPGAPKEERDAKYESYIYTCLYLDPPDSFERAVHACIEYLQAAGDQPSARILAYQAMAYGQKYDWEKKRGAPKEALASLKESALQAARKAIELQPPLRQLLRMTWDPNDPTKLRGEENDLEVFFDDTDFKQLLGS